MAFSRHAHKTLCRLKDRGEKAVEWMWDEYTGVYLVLEKGLPQNGPSSVSSEKKIVQCATV